MLFLGKQITSPGEILEPVPVEKVYKGIRNEKGEVATLQRRLREIRLLDVNQYRKLKTALPYLVCGHFQPRIRKKENFAFTERFFVDIDHLSEYDLDINEVKQKVATDERVELIFTSPGGDGLKVLFTLANKITDSSYYALFYKSFCIQFSHQYGLSGTVDTKTNDVSRCCFVSYDSGAFYRKDPLRINSDDFITIDEVHRLEGVQAEIKKAEQEFTAQRSEKGISNEKTTVLSDDILEQIRKRIGMKVRKRVEKSYVQPAQLDAVMPEVLQQLDSVGISMVSMRPIDYGRQIKVSAGQHWAEVNIFYGSRGPSIVATTKTGSNKDLCDSVVILLKDHFNITH